MKYIYKAGDKQETIKSFKEVIAALKTEKENSVYIRLAGAK